MGLITKSARNSLAAVLWELEGRKLVVAGVALRRMYAQRRLELRVASASAAPRRNLASNKNHVASTGTRTALARVNETGCAKTQRQRPAANRIISACAPLGLWSDTYSYWPSSSFR